MDDFLTGIGPTQYNPEFLPKLEPQTNFDFGLDFDRASASTRSLPDFNTTSFEDKMKNFASGGPSIETQIAPQTFDWKRSNADRYISSDYYKSLGFDPYRDNESLYGYRQTWGNTLNNALSGAWRLGTTGFVDGWKGWGRMSDALFSMDWSKLAGDEESLKELNDRQNEVMNQNAIYSTPESDATFWNRKTFGNFLQQSGFTLGTVAQVVTEQALTKLIEAGLTATGVGAGAAAALEASTDAKSAASVAKLASIGRTAKQLNEAGALWKNNKIMTNLMSTLKGAVPGVQMIADMKAAKDLGQNGWNIARIGLGGLKRGLSEANLAMTEARMESAGTYGALYDSLYYDYLDKNGQAPLGKDLESISQTAYSAAKDNFIFNSALLGAMNRIQFDNMFKSFKAGTGMSQFIGGAEEGLASKLLKVEGKVGEKELTQFYKKGMFGSLGLSSQISKDFGKVVAAKEVGKSILKHVGKWEFSEGIQEVLQTGSNDYFTDYYTDLYKGNPIDRDKNLKTAVDKAVSMEGLKTFMSGALTGMITAGPTAAITKAFEYAGSNKKEVKKADENLKSFVNQYNGFLKSPASYLSPVIKNFNIQAQTSEALDKAIKRKDKFAFENLRDTSLAELAAHAVRTNTHEALIDTLRDYGKYLTKEEFEQAFVGFDYNSKTKISASQYTDHIANVIESYADTYRNLHDKLDNKVNPELYRQGTIARKEAEFAKQAQDTVIEILAGNSSKAEATLKRMTDIYSKASTNPRIGSSLGQTFTIMGSDNNTANEISILKKEIKDLELTPSKDRESTQILKRKKEQLEALETFKEHKSKYYEALEEAGKFTIKNNKGEVVSEYDSKEEADKNVDALHKTSVKLLRKSFADYINSKNQENNISTIVTESDYDNQFSNLNDYIKLNAKAKNFTDAYNLLIDPKNFAKLQQRFMEGARSAATGIMVDMIEKNMNKRGFIAANEDLINKLNELAKVTDKTDDQIREYYDLLNELGKQAANYTDERNAEYVQKLAEVVFKDETFREQHKDQIEELNKIATQQEQTPQDSDEYKQLEIKFVDLLNILYDEAEEYLKNKPKSAEAAPSKTESPTEPVQTSLSKTDWSFEANSIETLTNTQAFETRPELVEFVEKVLGLKTTDSLKTIKNANKLYLNKLEEDNRKKAEINKEEADKKIVDEKLELIKAADDMKKVNDLQKQFEEETIPGNPLSTLSIENLDLILNALDTRRQEFSTFAKLVPYNIIEYKKGEEIVYYQVMKVNENYTVDLKEYPTGKQSYLTLSQTDINNNTVQVYKNAATMILEQNKETDNLKNAEILEEDQKTAEQSQKTSKDFFNDKDAVEKAIAEADNKTPEQLEKDLLDSLGCE